MLATSNMAVSAGSGSNTGTQPLNPQLAPLPTCTATPGGCAGGNNHGAGDWLWNAKKDLVTQLNANAQCVNSKLASIETKAQWTLVSTWDKTPITATSLASYLNNNIGLFDGTKSTYRYQWVSCGQKNPNCGATAGLVYIKDDFTQNPDTTADTVTPSSPFKSFWQPSYTAPGTHDLYNLGVGINYSNDGVNIENESTLFHEALHGMTGIYDYTNYSPRGGLKGIFCSFSGTIPPSECISAAIRDNILSACFTF
jgi:hypothetical protein